MDNFTRDEIYNTAFRNICKLLKEGQRGRQYEIWLRKGATSDTQFGFHNVVVGNSIYDISDVKPLRLLVNWVPNDNDAGRILRKMVDETVKYLEGSGKESKEGEDLSPDATPQDSENNSDPQTPGVG